jgi:4-methyl-5(b-hydroxyethyl)-thiazole monophosphate biosynthesis
MELAPFLDVMGWARNDHGMEVEVVTAGFTKTVVSTFGIPVMVDKTFDEMDISEYDALAIPGGFEEFGFYEDAYDERFLNLIRDFDSAHKYIASICVGALPIGASGVLKGRKATTYHLGDGRRQKQLSEFGVEVIPYQSVVIDQNIITSFCPETAPHVAISLLEMLVGKEKAGIVATAMGF